MSGPVASTGFVHRPVVMGQRGIIAAGHHRAAEAGAAVLREGGNAMDAAVTAAATLAVAIPHMNGLGGDAFALWFDQKTGETVAINGSGGAPSRATIEAYRAGGHAAIPQRGPLSISVPGVLDAWDKALKRFGTVPLARALAPAIALAEEGLPLDRHQRDLFNGQVYRDLVGAAPALGALYGPGEGRRLGEVLRMPALARSLRQLASDGITSFYGGAIGAAMVKDLRDAGGILDIGDLERHFTIFGPPLSVAFRGRRVVANPPNTQGLALLALLGLIEADDDPNTPALARFMRAKEIAFAARDRYLGDPQHTRVPDDLLTPAGLAAFARTQAAGTIRSAPAGGDTSTLVVVDSRGNAVSWVQSLFEAFGSGVASSSTGIVFHNRLSLASLAPGGPNSLAPGRRPFHTLCPALVLNDGSCEFALATPGDHGQPQTLAQILIAVLDRGLDIQEAVEAPRIRHDSGTKVMYEDRLPEDAVRPLASAGYALDNVGPWSRVMGGANAIQCLPNGTRMAGADPRRASYAIVE